MAQEVDGGGNRRPEYEIPSSDSAAPPPEEDAGSFLERETLRRKRTLRFYLALLAVAVALGVAVVDEPIGAGAVAGLLLILAGSWLSTDGRLPPGIGARLGRLRAQRSAAGQAIR